MCLDYAIIHNVEHLLMRHGDYSEAHCLNFASIKILHLSWCRYLQPMDDCELPSLNSLQLRIVWFGDHISGFENLRNCMCPNVINVFGNLKTILH